MVLLSRIKFEQGLVDESLRFASKALTFRKSCLGERLKVCDSLHQVAVLLHRSDNTGLAVQLLEECIKISRGLAPIEGVGHQARANYKLSQMLGELGKKRESAGYLEMAGFLRESLTIINSEISSAEAGPSSFERIVPWMLW